MNINVRKIYGGQQVVHPDLCKILDKHKNSPYLKPIASFNQEAFNSFQEFYQTHQGREIVLDLGCGTAQSTYFLATKYPTKVVIGIDRSEVRLTKKNLSVSLNNLKIIRADIEDFIRLFLDNNFIAYKIYFLYPNPYPKKSQISKRWYAHPLFDTFLKSAKHIEVRSNWKLYVEEFMLSLKHYGKQSVFSNYEAKLPITAFEVKYSGSNQDLFQLKTD